MSDVKVGRVEFGPSRVCEHAWTALGRMGDIFCIRCGAAARPVLPTPDPRDRRIAELEAEVAELRKRIDPCCGSCGSSDFYVDQHGTWCGNENCRRLIKPARKE